MKIVNVSSLAPQPSSDQSDPKQGGGGISGSVQPAPASSSPIPPMLPAVPEDVPAAEDDDADGVVDDGESVCSDCSTKEMIARGCMYTILTEFLLTPNGKEGNEKGMDSVALSLKRIADALEAIGAKMPMPSA